MKKIHFTDRYLLNPRHPVTVFVIGAGGTGSQVITNLARMSMALQALGHPGLHVTVFDPDTVSQSNIGRQLFSETELGLNKAVSLVTRINRFFGYAHGLPNRNVFLPGIFLKTAQQISSLPVRTIYAHVLRFGSF